MPFSRTKAPVSPEMVPTVRVPSASVQVSFISNAGSVCTLRVTTPSEVSTANRGRGAMNAELSSVGRKDEAKRLAFYILHRGVRDRERHFFVAESRINIHVFASDAAWK